MNCRKFGAKHFGEVKSICISIHFLNAIDRWSHTERHLLNVVENSTAWKTIFLQQMELMLYESKFAWPI